MRKIRLTIEYDGSAYQGWQVQATGPTVQAVLQEHLRSMTREENNLVGAGRTDSGVHAWGQVAHFVTETNIPMSGFTKGLNSLLPQDIRVVDAIEVPIDFHAQRSAKSKVYKYLVLNQDTPSALYRNYAWFIPHKLDFGSMEKACSILVGRHNFSSFQAADPKAVEPTRTMLAASLKTSKINGKSFLQFSFEANGFLKHMIRNIVGTVVEVGKGKVSIEDFKRIFDACDRTQAGPTCPPGGLYLVEVKY